MKSQRGAACSAGGTGTIRAVISFMLAGLIATFLVACGSSQQAVETTGQSATSAKLTVAEVKKALATLDTTWSPGGGGAVNVAAFARSILVQLPAAYTQPGLSDDAKTKRVDDAMAAYNSMVAAKGERAAFKILDNLQFASNQGVLSRKLTADEAAIAPLLNGMHGATLMFSHGDTPMWTWEVQSVSIVGPSTAKVTYTASPTISFVLGKDNPLVFKDPAARYQKVLEFENTNAGWRLAGWSNFKEFVHQIQANVQPDALTRPPLGWWELGSAR
jgi:hypothetical protein